MDTGAQGIRVLIADDHSVVRGGLVALLDEMPEMLVVGEASDGVQAIEQARRTQPDVILFDLIMPRKTGLEAIPELKKVAPHSQILILTSYNDDEKILAAIKAGAIGYLVKETSTADLCAAIRHAHQGLASLHPAIARRLIRELNRPTTLTPTQEPLTEREAEVLILIARGLTMADIAGKLLMHEQSVHRHITNILSKLWQGPHDPLDPPLPLPIPVR